MRALGIMDAGVTVTPNDYDILSHLREIRAHGLAVGEYAVATRRRADFTAIVAKATERYARATQGYAAETKRYARSVRRYIDTHGDGDYGDAIERYLRATRVYIRSTNRYIRLREDEGANVYIMAAKEYLESTIRNHSG